MVTKKIITKKAAKQSDDEKILGIAPKKDQAIEIYDYSSSKVKYKVTNLELNNLPVIVDGSCIETFIGSSNLTARRQLKNGAKEVITYYEKTPMYKIEVLD